MSNHSEQNPTLQQPNQDESNRQKQFVGAEAICCAYCGVVILPAECRARTANYFSRWGYLHDTCETAMARQLYSDSESLSSVRPV